MMQCVWSGLRFDWHIGALMRGNFHSILWKQINSVTSSITVWQWYSSYYWLSTLGNHHPIHPVYCISCVLHFLKVITSCWTQQQDTDRSLPHEPQKRRLYLCQYKHRNNLFLANSVYTLPTPQVRLFPCQYKLCSMAYPLLNHCQLLNTKFCFCQHKSTLKWPIPG